MKISVAMCTYNGERFVRQQLDSFVNQTRLPDELVVCDDKSSDRTPCIVQAFAQRAPFTVRLIQNQETLGSTRNFVRAISLCQGELIALSDQDDIWHPEKLSQSAAIIESNAMVDAVFTDGELIDEHSRPLGPTLWHSLGFTPPLQALVSRQELMSVLKKQYFITGATLMFHARWKHLLKEIPAIWVHDAWITWMIAMHGRVSAIPNPLIGYRLHGANQVGVNTQSASELLKTRTVQTTAALLNAEMKQLSLLRSAIEAESTKRSADAIRTIDGRLMYLRMRSAVIRRNRASRPLFAFAALPEYFEFGKGLRSLLGDLAL